LLCRAACGGRKKRERRMNERKKSKKRSVVPLSLCIGKRHKGRREGFPNLAKKSSRKLGKIAQGRERGTNVLGAAGILRLLETRAEIRRRKKT